MRRTSSLLALLLAACGGSTGSGLVTFRAMAGGPADATDVISLRLFKEAFTNFNMGIGATVAMLVFVIDIVLSGLYILLLRQKADAV